LIEEANPLGYIQKQYSYHCIASAPGDPFFNPSHPESNAGGLGCSWFSDVGANLFFRKGGEKSVAID
jgi:hypothetical protein